MYKEGKTYNVIQGKVPDFRTFYKEDLLNGADPVLSGDLVPVKINETDGTVTKADIAKQWYKYEDKEWANAVILKEGVETPKDNAEIKEDDIESYFVWIPKYRYKIFDMGQYTNTTKVVNKSNQAVEIQFSIENTKDNFINAKGETECATPMLTNGVQGASGESGTCQKDYWMTPPAFLAFGTNGLWVGKFETSKTSTNTVQIKPNVTSWMKITLGDSFTESKNYKESLFSHNMKNTEWGAVTYLTQSIYGRCKIEDGVSTCETVTKNSNSSYITGMEGTATAYPSSQNASTTGNNTGIFDMSGGAWEATMSARGSSDLTPAIDSRSKLEGKLTDPRYYDVYIPGNYYDYSRRILGDATGELGPFGVSGSSSSKYSSYGSYAYIVDNTRSYFYRGGHVKSGGGIFDFRHDVGNTFDGYGFRIVLSPTN